MPKKPRVRTLMDSQRVKTSERLLKSVRHHVCHIFLWIWKTFSAKNSILVASEILRLFVNILTPNEKCFHSVNASVNATNSNGIISNLKNIFRISFCISEMYIKSGIPWKKNMNLTVISFWTYRLQKAGLLKCLKSPVSEHLWTVNMLKGPKHCINLKGSIFVIFFDHSERKSARKTLF